MSASLQRAYRSLAEARIRSGLPFGDLAPGLQECELRQLERSTGKIFPDEYVAFCELHSGEMEPFNPFYMGWPFVPLRTAIPIYLGVRELAKEVPYAGQWEYVRFSELDGNGLHFQTCTSANALCPLYDVGHGTETVLEYRSIEALLMTIVECLNRGLTSAVTGEDCGQYEQIEAIAKRLNG